MGQIKMSNSEETVRAIVREGSPGGRSETTGDRICETGRSTVKPGVHMCTVQLSMF